MLLLLHGFVDHYQEEMVARGVCSDVGGFDIESVAAVRVLACVPGGCEFEAVAAGLVGVVLAGAARIDGAIARLGGKGRSKVGDNSPRNHFPPPPHKPPAHQGRRDRQALPGGRRGDRWIVVRLSDEADDAGERASVQKDTAPFGDDAIDDGRAEIGERRQRAGAQRVPVAAVAALGEVHVPPSSSDMAEKLVPTHALAGTHARTDVPVTECARFTRLDDGDVLRALELHRPRRDRIDSRSVRRRHIDAEMKRARPPRDPRITEVPAHGVLPIEWLNRPAVAHIAMLARERGFVAMSPGRLPPRLRASRARAREARTGAGEYVAATPVR